MKISQIIALEMLCLTAISLKMIHEMGKEAKK